MTARLTRRWPITLSGDPGRGVPSGPPSGILVAAKPQQEGFPRVNEHSNHLLTPCCRPADGRFWQLSALSAAREELFNPHSGRGREGRGFVQPGSI